MRQIVALCLMALLGGCREAPPAPPATDDQRSLVELQPDSPVETLRYECDDVAFTALFYNDRAIVQLAGRELLLPGIVGATGPRYSDGRSTLWREPGQATLEHDGRTYVCPVTPG